MDKVGIKQLIVGSVFLLIGIYMFFNPIGTFSVFTNIFGVVIILFGTNELFTLIKTKNVIGFQKLFNYLAIIFGGVIMVLATKDWIDLLGYVIGIFFLITGITKILEHYKRENTINSISIYGILITLLGIIVLFEPEVGIEIFTVLLSISLIIAGFSQLMIGFVVRKFTTFNFSQDMTGFNDTYNHEKSEDNEKDIIDVDYRDVD